MLQLTIGEASGRKVEKPDGSYMFLQTYDPFTRTWMGSGYNADLRDPFSGMVTDVTLRGEYGIDIVPSKAELDQIETLRLSNRVKRAATELSAAINDWLHHPQAR